MKNIFLILVISSLLNSCNNDDNQLVAPQLPEATGIGANTAGCLVDGEVFLSNNKSLQPLVCYYLDGEDFVLSISREDEEVYQKIYIYIGDTNLEVGKTYPLGVNLDDSSKYGEYYIRREPLPYSYTFFYQTNSSFTGELTITHNNYEKGFLSGTFWFDAKYSDNFNYTGEIDETKVIKVREGRFDMKY